MTPQEIVDKALDYRNYNVMYARFDLQAALEHAPNCSNCSHRFGSDVAALAEALELLG